MAATVSSTPERNSLRSQSLDLLRFPLAIVVVCIHIIASRTYVADNRLIHIDRFPGADMFFGIFDAFLRNQSVPIYYFIAGYVFFWGVHLTMERYGKKLRNRYHSLLLPYLAWNILAIIITFIQYETSPASHTMFRLNPTIPGVLECFWNSWYGLFERLTPFPSGAGIYPQDYPLWFVRDLMIIVAFAPLIYRLLRTTRGYVVMALAAAWFILSPFKLGHTSQLLSGFFFFVWGGYMSFHKRDMIKEFRKFAIPSTLGYIALGAGYLICIKSHPDFCPVIKALNTVAGMVMAYSLASFMLEIEMVKVNKFLAAASFFVYAGHGIFVAHVNNWIFDLIRPREILSAIACYAACLVIVVGGLLLLFLILAKWLPRVHKIFAGRSWPQKPAHA